MNTFNIVGIDPGGNTGFAILKINLEDLSIVNIDTFNVKITNYSHDEEMISRLNTLSNVVRDIYTNYSPNLVCMENMFINPKFPNAVMILTQYVTVMTNTWHECNPLIKIHKYAPKFVKSAVTVGTANKDDMKDTVRSIPELAQQLSHLDYMTEHEIDSVCIAYCGLQDIRNNPFILWSV